MAGNSPELPVILKMFDLVVWSCKHLSKFPRSFRFTLGSRLEMRLYDVQDGLLRAKYQSGSRGEILQSVNMDLELLRFQFRLAHALGCLSTDSYGYAARAVDEVGQMVGGWLRHASRGGNA